MTTFFPPTTMAVNVQCTVCNLLTGRKIMCLSAAMAQWWSFRLPIGRLGVWSTATKGIAVALLGQERSPQSPRQGANSRLRPAANCRHQNSNNNNNNLNNLHKLDYASPD